MSGSQGGVALLHGGASWGVDTDRRDIPVCVGKCSGVVVHVVCTDKIQFREQLHISGEIKMKWIVLTCTVTWASVRVEDSAGPVSAC